MISNFVLNILACPYCHSGIKQLKNKFVCTKCHRKYTYRNGVIILLKGINEDDVKLSHDRWDNIYASNPLTRNYRHDTTILSYKRFIDRYKKYFNNGIYLDLGCGIAWTAALFASEGFKILGLDLSFSALRKSADLFSNANLKGTFVQADILNLPLKSKSLSFIYAGASLEYIRNTSQAIGELSRVLKTSGRVVIVVPVVSLSNLTYHQLRGDIPSIWLIGTIIEFLHLKVFQGRFMHYGYERSLTVSNIKKMFDENGFILADLNYFDMYYPIKFIPEFIRPLVRFLLRLRPFWPMAYFEAIKK